MTATSGLMVFLSWIMENFGMQIKAFTILLLCRYAAQIAGGVGEVIILGLTRLRDWLNSFDTWKKLKTDDLVLNGLIGATRATQNTVVDRIKRENNGSLPPEKIPEITEFCFKTFVDALHPADYEHIKNDLGDDFEEVIKGRIPIVVDILKGQIKGEGLANFLNMVSNQNPQPLPVEKQI